MTNETCSRLFECSVLNTRIFSIWIGYHAITAIIQNCYKYYKFNYIFGIFSQEAYRFESYVIVLNNRLIYTCKSYRYNIWNQNNKLHLVVYNLPLWSPYSRQTNKASMLNQTVIYFMLSTETRMLMTSKYG